MTNDMTTLQDECDTIAARDKVWKASDILKL